MSLRKVASNKEEMIKTQVPQLKLEKLKQDRQLQDRQLPQQQRIRKLKQLQKSLASSPRKFEEAFEKDLQQTSRLSMEALRHTDVKKYHEILTSRQSLIAEVQNQAKVSSFSLQILPEQYYRSKALQDSLFCALREDSTLKIRNSLK